MKNEFRTVSICRLPAQITGAEKKAILIELECRINVDRPAVVFDCSMLRVLDQNALYLLLCCLEEALKRNGDIRLAALRPEERDVLQSAQIASLFQCFETIDEAVESFHLPQIDLLRSKSQIAGSPQSEMNAA